jgi:hypothetical protein
MCKAPTDACYSFLGVPYSYIQILFLGNKQIKRACNFLHMLLPAVWV